MDHHPADKNGYTEILSCAEGDWWQLAWMRHRDPVPDNFHEAILAWLSDYYTVSLIMKPHGYNSFSMQTSLDHSIHFHKPFRVDEWLLFHAWSTVSTAARGLAQTEVYDSKGQLVATVTQEALIRPHRGKGSMLPLTNVNPSVIPGLHDKLQLKQIAQCDVFTGTDDRTPWGRVYGGQALAQSIAAAQRTVPADQKVHSIHGYFLLAGESGIELLFDVERVRDGRSFATRTVKAIQRNKAIFEASISFHVNEAGLTWQTPRRDVHAMAQSRGLDRIPGPGELMKNGAQVLHPEADVFKFTEIISVARGKWWIMLGPAIGLHYQTMPMHQYWPGLVMTKWSMQCACHMEAW
eukprot:gnl/MRDRNA2_/MRDRNA2_63055_c0_seq1.p1 gnl/MRDRNA2_/MRDRNA2_63055_c0~~gnl/MRDRNA2_/MRDRNA2_63055_c0_seq1.p1  ORF type:complete len:372 (+),score=55.61 gnl/MRDRNA2_/MRDRNA2_63055_c0_seq1:69-1118(+)